MMKKIAVALVCVIAASGCFSRRVEKIERTTPEKVVVQPERNVYVQPERDVIVHDRDSDVPVTSERTTVIERR